MPYTIRKKKNEYCVYNADTGEEEGCSDSLEEAVAHRNVLYGVHHGWQPTRQKKKK